MAMDWSAMVKLKKMQVAAVEATKEPVLFARAMMWSAMTFNNPDDSMTPPKIIAHKISDIVFIIPNMPVVVSKSAIIGLEEVMGIVAEMAFMSSTNEEVKKPPSPPTSRMTCG